MSFWDVKSLHTRPPTMTCCSLHHLLFQTSFHINPYTTIDKSGKRLIALQMTPKIRKALLANRACFWGECITSPSNRCPKHTRAAAAAF